MPSLRITKSHYESLAALRYALRRFLNFSQDAARESGLTPRQHQALLAIKGFPGRDFASIAELAERLQLRHHSTVGLVDRLVLARLLRRRPSVEDRRRVELRLTAQGEKIIEQLSAIHLQELRQYGPELRRLISTISEIRPPDQLLLETACQTHKIGGFYNRENALATIAEYKSGRPVYCWCRNSCRQDCEFSFRVILCVEDGGLGTE